VRAWPTDGTSDAQVSHQWQEHRRVTRLAWGDQRDQREPVAIDELMDLRAQPATGAPDAVIGRAPHQGPEVDGTVMLPADCGLRPGAMAEVTFVGCEGADLLGELR